MIDGVQAVMFDLDGTLVDSLDCYHATFLESFGRMGLPVVEKARLLELMRQGHNILDTLIPTDWPERPMAIETCRGHFRDIWARRAAEEVHLLPVAADTLRALKDEELLIGLATAASGPWIARLLELNEITRYFDAVVTYGDVRVRKPAPDILLRCMDLLGADAARSVYVGDSPIDILAAKAAGVRPIGVLTGASDRAALEEVGPDIILDHVGEVPAVLRTKERDE